MNKTVLIVIAAHHLSGNVASLRYRGLLKYVNANKYKLFVITQPNPLAEPVVAPENIVEVEGKTFSRATGFRYLLYVMLCSFWKTLPFRIGHLNMNSWAINAALAADSLIAKEQAEGNRCIVLGTFCPLDAVVASSCVASRNDVTLIQDFRDGLGFEPIGNQSFPALWVKRVLENRIVAGATGMLAVSDPIVNYLREKYPDKQVVKISNGFDREDFQ